MPLFDKIGKKPESRESGQQVTPEMMRQEIGNISADPGAYLGRRGFNIPKGMTDPKDITTYLLKTGQVGGSRLQQVMRMLGGPGGK